MSIFDFLRTKQSIQNETKAIGNDYFNNFFSINSDSEKKTYTPKELLLLNTGWIATCNSKNAQTIASVPIKLYYKNSTGKELKWIKHKDITTKNIQFLKDTTKKDITNEIIEIVEHPILDLLEKPNERMNWLDMVSFTQSYLGLIGNCYWYLEKDGEDITKIYPLLSENVSAICKETDFGWQIVDGYKYTSNFPKLNSRTFTPEEILHFSNYQPSNSLYGKGELEFILSSAERQQYYNTAENYINKNNARPDFLVQYKNGIKENEIKEVNRAWYKKFGSAKNAGKPVVVGGEVEIKNLSLPPKEMSWSLGREWLLKEIAAAYGVPTPLLNLQETNYASAASAMDFYMETTIKPKLERFLEKINEQIVSVVDPELFVWYDGTFITSENPLEAAQIDQIYINSGVYDAAYVRDRLDVPEQFSSVDNNSTGVTKNE